MTDTQTPERITAGPDSEHGWLHATCSNALPQSESDQTFVRADIHEAVVAERNHALDVVDAAKEEIERLKAKLTELEKHRA